MPDLLCYPRVLDFEQLKSIAKAKEWMDDGRENWQRELSRSRAKYCAALMSRRTGHVYKSLWKAESSQLVWKNRTASLLFEESEQRVPDIASPVWLMRKRPKRPPYSPPFATWIFEAKKDRIKSCPVGCSGNTA
jgi:hypothetical protein